MRAMAGDMLGMGAARLDRLEAQAQRGYASPEQMIKLIGEVRRRRQEMATMEHELAQLRYLLGVGPSPYSKATRR